MNNYGYILSRHIVNLAGDIDNAVFNSQVAPDPEGKSKLEFVIPRRVKRLHAAEVRDINDSCGHEPWQYINMTL